MGREPPKANDDGPLRTDPLYYRVVSKPVLSESQVEAFRRDGFVVVKGLIDAGQVRELLADYDKVLRGEIEVPAFGDRRVKGSMVQLANPSQHLPHWRDHAYFRRALAAARSLIGPDAAYQYDQLIMKPAHYPAETDWHQDAGYWQDRNGSDRAVTCWLALTPAWQKNGGMQFIPGSHLGPIQEHFSIAEPFRDQRRPGNHDRQREGRGGKPGAGGCNLPPLPHAALRRRQRHRHAALRSDHSLLVERRVVTAYYARGALRRRA